MGSKRRVERTGLDGRRKTSLTKSEGAGGNDGAGEGSLAYLAQAHRRNSCPTPLCALGSRHENLLEVERLEGEGSGV